VPDVEVESAPDRSAVAVLIIPSIQPDPGSRRADPELYRRDESMYDARVLQDPSFSGSSELTVV
jgi:hypothetical protein